MVQRISRIDLKRDFAKHKEEYMDAIVRVCQETAFSGGKFADKFDEEFAEYVGTVHLLFTVPCLH